MSSREEGSGESQLFNPWSIPRRHSSRTLLMCYLDRLKRKNSRCRSKIRSQAAVDNAPTRYVAPAGADDKVRFDTMVPEVIKRWLRILTRPVALHMMRCHCTQVLKEKINIAKVYAPAGKYRMEGKMIKKNC